MVNVYREGEVRFNPTKTIIDNADTRVRLVMTVSNPISGLNMPAKYEITLPGGKQIVLAIATAPNVYTNSFASYETPAFLYDSSGTQIIGTGLIEANFYLSNDVLAKRMIAQAGGNLENTNEFKIVMNGLKKPQTVWQRLLAFIIVLIPLWTVIICVVFVVYKKDKRYVRFMLSIAILILLYGIWKTQI